MVGTAGPLIGILALQGGFAAHENKIRGLGARVTLVRKVQDLENLEGIIIPGGESSTFLKLLDPDLKRGLEELFQREIPVLTTCAGTILIAKEVSNPNQESFGLIDISVTRNAYGRQVDSFIQLDNHWSSLGKTILSRFDFTPEQIALPVETVFIRAPIIERVGPDVAVLLTVGEHPALVQYRHILAATFHPELSSGASLIHELFLRMRYLK